MQTYKTFRCHFECKFKSWNILLKVKIYPAFSRIHICLWKIYSFSWNIARYCAYICTYMCIYISSIGILFLFNSKQQKKKFYFCLTVRNKRKNKRKKRKGCPHPCFSLGSSNSSNQFCLAFAKLLLFYFSFRYWYNRHH